eukprot:7025224-Prymnesium_polylepis.2
MSTTIATAVRATCRGRFNRYAGDHHVLLRPGENGPRARRRHAKSLCSHLTARTHSDGIGHKLGRAILNRGIREREQPRLGHYSRATLETALRHSRASGGAADDRTVNNERSSRRFNLDASRTTDRGLGDTIPDEAAIGHPKLASYGDHAIQRAETFGHHRAAHGHRAARTDDDCAASEGGGAGEQSATCGANFPVHHHGTPICSITASEQALLEI